VASALIFVHWSFTNTESFWEMAPFLVSMEAVGKTGLGQQLSGARPVVPMSAP
jgi:hypothetical protein